MCVLKFTFYQIRRGNKKQTKTKKTIKSYCINGSKTKQSLKQKVKLEKCREYKTQWCSMTSKCNNIFKKRKRKMGWWKEIGRKG